MHISGNLRCWGFEKVQLANSAACNRLPPPSLVHLRSHAKQDCWLLRGGGEDGEGGWLLTLIGALMHAEPGHYQKQKKDCATP